MKSFLPVIFLWILINIFLFLGNDWMSRNGFSVNFITAANTILFLLSMTGFWIQRRNIHSSNAHAFVRGVMGSMLVKMLLIIAALFVYIMVAEGSINKPALFTSMAIYVLYTVIEVYQLMNIARKNSDG